MKLFKIQFATLVLIVFFSTSCSDKKDVFIEFSGKIVNLPFDEIKIIGDNIDCMPKVDELGYFKLRFESPKGKYYKCSIGDQYMNLYLIPGDRLHFTIDYEDFDRTLVFKGIGAEANNYLIRQFLAGEKYYKNDEEKFTISVAKFTEMTDKIYEEKNTLLNRAGLDKNLYSDFLAMEKDKILYAFIRDRLKYIGSYQYFTGKEAENLDNSYYSFFSKIDFNDTTLMNLSNYRETLKLFVEIQTQRIIDQKPELRKNQFGETIIILQLLKQTFSNKKIYNWLIDEFLENQISRFKVDDFLMKDIQEYYINKEQFKKYNQLFQRSKQLQSGNKAPDFSVYDIDDNVVMLKNFIGMYVYIDVWSTYCGPCIKEMPEFLTLSKEYNCNEVVFLCISIDNNKERWLDFIKKRNFTGIQLYAGGRRSDFSNDYLIEEIPRNILIDKEGKIIYARAPRPKEIKTELNQFIKMN